jgi:hypothetical protein
VRGVGLDNNGPFRLEGTLEQGGAFRASKTDSTSTVNYTGTMATRGASAVIAGGWNSGWAGDCFEIEIAPAPPLAGGTRGGHQPVDIPLPWWLTSIRLVCPRAVLRELHRRPHARAGVLQAEPGQVPHDLHVVQGAAELL